MDAAIDLSKITPELCAALAQAQAESETVGKDGNNTHGGYKYATAEAMIRGARKTMAKHGLAILDTWTTEPIDPPDNDAGQWVCAHVRCDWAIVHASGGAITGHADIDAIGSKRRPPDKAVAAAVTYAHGFILRGLLNLDRADEDTDAPDRREDVDGWGRGQSRPKQQPKRDVAPKRNAAAEAARAKMIEASAAVRAKAESLGWTRDIPKIASDAMGKPWDSSHDKTTRYTAKEYELIRRDLVVDLELMEAEEQLRKSGPPPEDEDALADRMQD